MDLPTPLDEIYRKLDLLDIGVRVAGQEWVARIPVDDSHLSTHGPNLLQKLSSSIECNQRSLSTSYLQWFAQYSIAIMLGSYSISHSNPETSKAWLVGFELLLGKFPKDL